MPDLRWRREPPTSEGLWFWRFPTGRRNRPVWVFTYGGVLCVMHNEEHPLPVSVLGNREWAGPIQEPKKGDDDAD